MVIDIQPFEWLEWCGTCKGRGTIPNNYNKPSICGECMGEVVIKYCDCGKSMPAWQYKCLNCIFKFDEMNEENDET